MQHALRRANPSGPHRRPRRTPSGVLGNLRATTPHGPGRPVRRANARAANRSAADGSSALGFTRSRLPTTLHSRHTGRSHDRPAPEQEARVTLFDSRSSALALAGCGLAATLALAGCSAGQISQSANQQPAVNGTLTWVGDPTNGIALRNVHL